jgi:hypothetical protein
MDTLSLLEWAEFVVPITVYSVLLYFFSLAYRRTKLRPFALWIFAAIVYIIALLARFIASFCYLTSRETLIVFTAAYDALWMVGLVINATAFVMLIRYLLSERERRGKDAA